MISRFFIDRPIFANVIAIITLIFGAVAIRKLPVERYPAITPPTVQVRTTYPGANAQVVADTVAAPIEQQINGVENSIYMSSTSASDGSYALTITFEIGTDLDIAQVLVQNRLAIAEPSLPEEVRRQGLSVKKQSTNIVLVISLTSPNGPFNALFMSNYATLRILDQLSRVAGVGEVRVVGGGPYSMRIWLDPDLLQARGLTTQDVVASLQEQNVQVAAGQIGQPPGTQGQIFQYTVTTLGRLTDEQQFRQIVIKRSSTGIGVAYLGDVAKVKLGAQTYDTFSSRNGLEAASILVYQLPGSNALEVARNVRAAIAELARDFPRTRIQHPLRHDLVRQLRHQRGLSDPHHRRHSCLGGYPVLPAELAGAARARDHGADHHCWCLCLYARGRLLDQPAHALRSGAGHRHRGG